MVVIDDFNAKSKLHCSQDSTNFEGITIENVTSKFGLSQIIKGATHILKSFSSCTDLIFTTQSDLVSGRIWCSPITASKLSPSDCIRKI